MTLQTRRLTLSVLALGCFAMLCVSQMRSEEPWRAIGPDGGDARAFASAPGDARHLYLGTTNSWIYESTDAGASWQRLARLDEEGDLVIDHIVVGRAGTIFAAAWALSHPGGGLWISHDGGHSWTEAQGLHGQSIRSFAVAPSDAATLFAGTLEGVFRSSDSGATWTEISPPGSKEIHEVESLAVDPASPDTIYAGTWHLPWKTTDGGKNWHNIKKGVIDDSDVFSIIIDPDKPHVVYASACSGIYKSDDAGELFRKVQGIPATARRTRVLRQDPVHRDTVYAGTTEGLYKTTDAGRTFNLLTADEVIVNDVWVDPVEPHHVLLATDRGGVLVSNDGGTTFAASNRGISERKVEAFVVGVKADDASETIFAGVVNDKKYGGVFVSGNRGATWTQLANGLDGRDVFALAQSPDGSLLAGTNSGIFALDAVSNAWQPRNTVQNTLTTTASENVRGTKVSVEKKVQEHPHVLDARVFALDLSGDAWLASTSGGLYTSRDQGATWQGGPVVGVTGYLVVAAHGKTMAAARPDGVVLSHDAGQNWWPIGIPTVLTRIHCLAFSPDGTLWLGAREGVYFSRDGGKSWLWVDRLPLVDVDALSFDTALDRLLVSSRGSDFIYALDPKTLDWKWWRTGYGVSEVHSAGGRLLAASLNNGILIEPDAAAPHAGK